MHFGQLVKQLRINARLTQERLAHRAELGVSSLSDIERGVPSRSHQDTVVALAAGLGLTGEARDLFLAAARGAVSGEQVLAAQARQDPPARADLVTPRQLPCDVAAFTGRDAQLGELGALLGVVREGRTAGPVIAAVSGMAGAGKSALVVHWAHQVAQEFPDGQLYVNLRGHGPGKPVPPAEVLGGFLRALGVADQDIPAGGERARLYRAEMSARRMLLILDDAASDEQVRPLLPASSSVMVLVTSRTPLDRLICTSGAWHRRLGPLPANDALALLRTLLGSRVDAEPTAARDLAGLCAWLPLALRVAAGRAAARPYLPLAELTAEVAGPPGRPAPPEVAGDTHGAVAAAVAASCQYLPPDAAELYRLLGLHPGTEWDQYAAAALIAGTPEHAERLLAMLADAYLIQPAEGSHPAGLSRYRTHDLLRGCAAALATVRDNPDERRAALSRMFGYYLAAAQAARDTITADPVHLAAMVARPHPASEPSAGTYLPPVGRPPSAWAWLDAELTNLAAVADYAAGHGWPGYATRLAAVVDHRLTGGHRTELRTITSGARRAARDAADRHAEACALIELGVMSDNDGDLAMAASYQQQALGLAEDCGDLATQARARNSLGLLRRVRGDYEHAAHQHQQGSYLARQAGDRRAEARALNNLGCALTWLGRYALAAENFAQALVAASQVGYRYGAATARANHGKTAYAPAPGATGSQPVITCAEIGDRYDEVYRWTQHLATFDLPGSPPIPAA